MTKRICSIILACLFVVSLAVQSTANQLTDYQNKLKSTESTLKEKEKQIKNTKADISWNKQKKDKVIKELEDMGLKKEEVEKQIQLLESAIQSLDEAIAKAEEEYSQQEELLKERLRSLYKRTTTVWELDELFKSKSLNEMFVRIHTMNQIADYDQRLLESVEAKRQEIEDLKEQKQVEIDNCLQQAAQYNQKIQDLEVSRSTLEKEIKTDEKTLKQYEKEQDQLKKESDEFEAMIKSLKSSNNLTWGGNLTWPMPTNTTIASPYGNRLHPIYKVWKMHTGIDIGSALNEYIVAADDGVVIYAGSRGGYGNTIIIDHGSGITTLYAHINTRGILVKVGQKVEEGQTIAKAGKTGTATGPHLHFEVRKKWGDPKSDELLEKTKIDNTGIESLPRNARGTGYFL